MNALYGNRFSLALLFSVATLSFAANHPAAQTPPPEIQARALATYGKLPLSFEENRGQADSQVRFLSRGSGYAILLTPSEVFLNVRAPGKPGQPAKQSSMRMSFPGAESSATINGAELQSAVSGYFVGKDASKWLSGIPNYSRVYYRGVYRGVDMVLYGNHGQLEYDFEVAPGADPRAIRLAFDGVDNIRIDGAGDLIVSTAAGEMRQHKPIVYQEGPGGRQIIQGQYVIQAHNHVAFEIARYDSRKPLVIDPVLNFATYLGSPGEDVFGISAAASTATYPAVAVDSQGNIYVTGYMGGNVSNFPGPPHILTAGGEGGGTDVFVVKMNPTGTALVYSVVFGTGQDEDLPGGIAVDAEGNAYVTGNTNSGNFPITPGAPQASLNGSTNAFVTQVNAAGTALVYSTYLGGNGNFAGNAIAVDHSGNAYVTGTAAYSGSGAPFPLVSPISSTPSAGFLTEIKAGGATGFAYSTYLPAGIGYGIAVDAAGDAFVTGSTGNRSVPSPAQGYALKVNAGGSGPAWTFTFGNSGAALQTVGFGIALDAGDDVYVAGMTNDASFPQITSPAAQSKYGGGLTDGFALKLNSSGSLVYGTYIGGLGSNLLPERGSGIGVDTEGNAYVSGTTQCIGFPTASPISGVRNGSAAVLMEGTVSGLSSNWSPTTLAGPFDQVDALAFDPSGNLYAGTSALSATGGGVYKLSGGAWTSANSGITSTTIDAVAVDPNTASTIYAAGSGHLYLTTNSGTAWTELAQAVGTAASIAIAKTSPSTVYVGSSSGLIYSTNSGTSWSNPSTAPGTGAVNTLVVDPNHTMTAYAGTPTGVYQTTNGGAAWAAVNTGLPTGPGGVATSLAINGTTSTIYAATPNGLFYTTNAGANWTQATLALEVAGTPFLVAVDHGNNVYLAFEGAGIATATNGGTAQSDWSPLTYNGLTQNQIVALAVPPNGSGTAYAGIISATTAFMTEISPNGQSFLSSTCIGGSDNNLGQSIAVSAGGSVFLSGLTTATNFPATPGAVQTSNAGLYDAFVMGIYTNTAVALTSSPSGAAITVSGSGCAPGGYTTPANLMWSVGSTCTVNFTDPQSISGKEYEFQSSTVNGSSVSHTNPLTVNSGGGNVAISATFSAIGSTGPATATHFSVTAPASATAGIPIQFTVTALNASNQTVTAYSDPVHFTSTDPAATLPADSKLTNGVGTFSASLVTPGAVTITASDLLSSGIAGTSGSIEVSNSTSGLRFISIPPCRVVDTRDATKPPGFGPPSLAGGSTRSFVIPSGPCSIPDTAQAYSLNVTAVPGGPLAYLTVWPTGQSQPVVSTLNSIDGDIQANAAIVAAGTGGAISVFATNETNLVLDINGYFVPNTVSNALGFYPMTPCRLVDTRPGAPSTILTGMLAAGTSTTVPILSSTCHVPAVAQAYSLNFTLVPPGPVAYMTVYPTGESLPIVSTLNDATGTAEANAAIAPAGTNGSIDVYVTQPTNLLVDINGYFAPVAEGALSLYALPPCRVLDTRTPAGSPPFVGAINVDVTGSGCGGTSAAQGYVFNATVVPVGPLAYLTLWPDGSVQPVVSTLNAFEGAITSNMAIVPTSNTDISAFASNTTYLVLDMFGYFAP
jgi:hypothetical protein